MKKALSMLLAAMMLLTLALPALAEDQVLTVVTWDATTTPYLIAQKEAFEASHPGVTIEYVDVASQDYAVKATTMLAGGDSSDVFMVKEITDLLNWQEAGYEEPLNSYIEASGYDLSGFAGIESNYAVDGEQYALPFRSDFWVLYYNKDLFDAAGVDYPTNDMTWEQYADLAEKMTSDGNYGTHYHTWLSAVVNWDVCDGVNTLIDGDYSDLAYFYELYQGLEEAGACMAYDELKAAGLHYSAAFENLVRFHHDRRHQGRHLQLQLGHRVRSPQGRRGRRLLLRQPDRRDDQRQVRAQGSGLGVHLLAGRRGRLHRHRHHRHPSGVGLRGRRHRHGFRRWLPERRCQQGRAGARVRGHRDPRFRAFLRDQHRAERGAHPDHDPREHHRRGHRGHERARGRDPRLIVRGTPLTIRRGGRITRLPRRLHAVSRYSAKEC